MGDVTTSLNKIAVALHEAGLAGAWRDEQLAVPDQFGHRKGTVERAAVRPLGITTLAVHLVGQSLDGRFWVQQRAFDKSNDPGLWDTLMGGMVSAADTVETALVRETWEEAGLHTAAAGHALWRAPERRGARPPTETARVMWWRTSTGMSAPCPKGWCRTTRTARSSSSG
jgi:hypothetical protein